ncbi:ATP-binding cassette domain-containing protein [Paenibacillus aurantius]|uniref:ATP-binding cassette domain-containing protein n=1 Tax=Paenibacillus aurantius TaxID=2918900 RepID=A0AA96RGI5_9BACL|nr:ATP-binding cassette domain-containing protein [Paenibacillus aurantius]WNQ12373.1 ATP-binding cassette domain-containing protein [Paenibacillus aurantius]
MEPEFELRGLSVEYEKADQAEGAGTETVLQSIDLQIRPGQWLGVAGPNGSGKSTLGLVLAGLSGYSSGIREPGWTEGRRIGMVMQNPESQIVGETVWEDVCFGLEWLELETAERKARAAAALERVGLTAKKEEKVERLSGGQKQLLAIAGSLAAGSPMIVFDEATAMLDPVSRERVWKAAKDLTQEGTAVVWITQWMEELAGSGAMLALEKGRVIYSGTPSGFFYGKEDEDAPSEKTPCEQLGFTAPYPVRLVQELMRQGFRLSSRPLTVEEAVRAVEAIR